MIEIMKSALKFTLSKAPILDPNSKVIFTYHDISNENQTHYSPSYSTQVEVFKRQIAWIHQKFNCVSLDSLLNDSRRSGTSASITFDDGFYSVLETAHPFLKSLDIPYTVFANVCGVENNFIDYGTIAPSYPNAQSKIYLDRADILYLAKEGVEIGSHGYTHQKFSNLNEPQLAKELGASKEYLEKITQNEVKYFAFPFGKKGHFTPLAVDLAKKAGYKNIFSSNPSVVKDTDPMNRFLMPRISILNETANEIGFYINRSIVKKIEI